MTSTRQQKIFIVIAVIFIVISNLLTYTRVTKGGNCALCVHDGDAWDCISQQNFGGDTCTVNGAGTKCGMEGVCGGKPGPKT